jgi:protein-tyrosine phosphatase
MPRIDANEILPLLWQGSKPPTGPALRNAGFDTVVLTAKEVQPSASEYPGVRVLRAALDDRPWVPAQEAHRLAQQVAAEVRAGRKVLVTCYMGWNRSGLVTMLALWYLTGRPGVNIVQHVRARRPVPRVMANRYFEEHVKLLPPRRLDGRGGRGRRLSL